MIEIWIFFDTREYPDPDFLVGTTYDTEVSLVSSWEDGDGYLFLPKDPFHFDHQGVWVIDGLEPELLPGSERVLNPQPLTVAYGVRGRDINAGHVPLHKPVVRTGLRLRFNEPPNGVSHPDDPEKSDEDQDH